MAAAPDNAEREEVVVYCRRFREAKEYGLPWDACRDFAQSDIDIGALRRLKRLGCPPLLAERILRN